MPAMRVVRGSGMTVARWHHATMRRWWVVRGERVVPPGFGYLLWYALTIWKACPINCLFSGWNAWVVTLMGYAGSSCLTWLLYSISIKYRVKYKIKHRLCIKKMQNTALLVWPGFELPSCVCAIVQKYKISSPLTLSAKPSLGYNGRQRMSYSSATQCTMNLGIYRHSMWAASFYLIGSKFGGWVEGQWSGSNSRSHYISITVTDRAYVCIED